MRSQHPQLERLAGRDHVLLCPELYVGSLKREARDVLLYSPLQGLYRARVHVSEALCSVVDGLIRATAEFEVQRDEQPCAQRPTFIDFQLDRLTGRITVRNDGVQGALCYDKFGRAYSPLSALGTFETTPQACVQDLDLFSGNYGHVIKLANVYSSELSIIIEDDGKRFAQTWRDNMGHVDEPTIVSTDIQCSTIEISFIPDYERFDMPTGLDDEHSFLFMRRVLDLAGCTPDLMVSLNGSSLLTGGFQQYCSLVYDAINPPLGAFYALSLCGAECSLRMSIRSAAILPSVVIPIDELTAQDDWLADYMVRESLGRYCELALAYTGTQFSAIGYCLFLHDEAGSTLIDTFLEALAPLLSKALWRDLPKNNHYSSLVKFSAKELREELLCIYRISCDPRRFKDPVKNWKELLGEENENKVLARFVERLSAAKAIREVLTKILHQKVENLQASKYEGRKKLPLRIPKLDDAADAGTKASGQCTLILTEGDSAKAFAVEGITSMGEIGRKKYGVFPLSGTLLTQIQQNMSVRDVDEVILTFMKILGLRYGVDYRDPRMRRTLRYGKLVLMMDQDSDGMHIRGIILNLFNIYWRSLLESNTFFYTFKTPLIRCSSPFKSKQFYSLHDYHAWLRRLSTKSTLTSTWKVSYYKGLGGHGPAEASKYFKHFQNHWKQIIYTERCAEKLQLAFSPKLSDQRKDWILQADKRPTLNPEAKTISVTDFVDCELIHHALSTVDHAVPSVMDGLKVSQRKVLYACFKRNLTRKLKVYQIAGYTADEAVYHHNEDRLCEVIVKMAQTHTGSNNIPLLYPAGFFGSRSHGGANHAKPRYAAAYLHPLTRYLFPIADDQVLKYLECDDKPVEPRYYAPILPMVLINGTIGLGVGFSTMVPGFNPLDILHIVRLHLYGRSTRSCRDLKPYSHNWTGEVTTKWDGGHKLERWEVMGNFKVLDYRTIAITELPLGTWTRAYCDEIETWIRDPRLVGVTPIHSSPSDTSSNKIVEKPLSSCTVCLSSVVDCSVGDKVIINVTLTPESAAEYIGTTPRDIEECNTSGSKRHIAILKAFRLKTHITASNMWLQTPTKKVKLYKTPFAIIHAFYTERLWLYRKRRATRLSDLHERVLILSERIRFIELMQKGKMELFTSQQNTLTEAMWRLHSFHPQKDMRLYLLAGFATQLEEEPSDDDELHVTQYVRKLRIKRVSDKTGKAFFESVQIPSARVRARCYKYLFQAHVYDLTDERHAELKAERRGLVREIRDLQNTHPRDIWLMDLARFELAYQQDLKMEMTPSSFTRKIIVNEEEAKDLKLEIDKRYKSYPPVTGLTDNEGEDGEDTEQNSKSCTSPTTLLRRSIVEDCICKAR